MSKKSLMHGFSGVPDVSGSQVWDGGYVLGGSVGRARCRLMLCSLREPSRVAVTNVGKNSVVESFVGSPLLL